MATFTAASFAGVIVTYDVLQNSMVAPDVTAKDLNHGAGVNRLLTNYQTNNYRESNLTDAIADDDYVTFGFQSVDKYDLTNVTFQARSRNRGPQNLVVMASVDNAAFQQVGAQQFLASFVRTQTVDLSSLSGVDDVELRFYLWGEGTSSFTPYFHLSGDGALGTDMIVVNGDLSAVPEPSSCLLLLLISSGLVLRRRRSAENL